MTKTPHSLMAVLACLMACGVWTYGSTGETRDLVRLTNADRTGVRSIEACGALVNLVDVDGVLAEASPEVQTALRAAGYVVHVVTPNIGGVYDSNFRSSCGLSRYLDYTEFLDSMLAISRNNPGITKLETLGTSSMNRRLVAIKFSDNPLMHENEPAVYFEGCIHGNEKITWAVVYEMVKYLAANYGADSLVTRLVDTREIWLAPMVNPDGYEASRRYNGNNVDLNRNWGWMWGSEARPGSSPFSEPESKAVLGHLLRHPMVMVASYHSGTEFISYPWSYSPDSIPEKRLARFLSQRYAVPNGYEVGQGCTGMYPINGSTKDFDYGQGILGWSIEIHDTKTPPASEIVPTFSKNRPAMLELIHRAAQGIHGTITDACGRPVHAQIWVEPADWPSYNDTELGDFHRFYLPGTYSVTFRSPGYRDTTVMEVVVPSSGDSAVTLDVQLTADTTASLFGYRLVCNRSVIDTTNHTSPIRTLGRHDNAAFQLDSGRFICLDMSRPVRDQPGPDLTVYRSSSSGAAMVQGSGSWQGPWTTVGTASDALSSFDISAVGLDSLRYVKLTASSTFHLDAIEGPNYAGVAETHLAEPESRTPGLMVQCPTRSPVRFTLNRQPEMGTVLRIHDVAGRLVSLVPASRRQVVLNKALPAGVYFASLNSGNQAVKLVIER